MSEPTIFVDVGQTGSPSPIAMAIKSVASVFGAKPVDQLVDTEDVEADIAITDSVAQALRLMKESEGTTIVVVHLKRSEGAEADAFASRFPERVRSVNYIGLDEAGDVTSFVPFLIKLIAEKATEESDENPAG